mgnify:CR=1 FL=1
MGSPIAPERRKGYLRSRPVLAERVAFTLDGYDFETDGKDLWVTPPGSARIDRIKVSRYLGDQSIRRGYPRELIRPEPLTEGWARMAALPSRFATSTTLWRPRKCSTNCSPTPVR